MWRGMWKGGGSTEDSKEGRRVRERVGETVGTVVSPPQGGSSRWSVGELKRKAGIGKQVILAIVKAYDREPPLKRRVKVNVRQRPSLLWNASLCS
jgi:hypothetical protein